MVPAAESVASPVTVTDRSTLISPAVSAKVRLFAVIPLVAPGRSHVQRSWGAAVVIFTVAAGASTASVFTSALRA